MINKTSGYLKIKHGSYMPNHIKRENREYSKSNKKKYLSYKYEKL